MIARAYLEFGALNDIVVDVLHFLNLPCVEGEWGDMRLLSVYSRLPVNIRSIAEEWGTSDTVFRDEACEWLRKNWSYPNQE